MFERFTDGARRVVVLAQEESRLLEHNYIGTEHILLGLVHEGEGVAGRALAALGVSLEDVRREVERMVGRGAESPTGHIPFTPRAKKVLELSLREALSLGHKYIGTEHILLGLMREGEGVAAQVLVLLGAGLDEARRAVIELLSGHEIPVGAPVRPREPDVMTPARCPRCSRDITSASYREVVAGEGPAARRVAVIACPHCGTAFGIVDRGPADEPEPES